MRSRALTVLFAAGLAVGLTACNSSENTAPVTTAKPAPTTTTPPPTTAKPGITLPGGITLPPDLTIPPGVTLPPIDPSKLPKIDPSKLPKLPPGVLPDIQFPESKYPSQPDPNTPGVKVQKGPDATVYSLANDVSFDFDSEVLKPQAKDSLTKVAAQLNGQYGGRPVEVRGHADNRGEAEYNLKLSERRALAVKNFLVSQGVAADRIKTIGFGETAPVDSNDSPEGRAHNRRVEVLAVTKK